MNKTAARVIAVKILKAGADMVRVKEDKLYPGEWFVEYEYFEGGPNLDYVSGEFDYEDAVTQCKLAQYRLARA